MIKSLYDALITDVLGGPYKEDPKVIALAYALREGIRIILDHTDNITTLMHLETLDDTVLDLLAAELRTQYYDTTYSKEVKASLIRHTLRWHQIAGTKAAVEELAAEIFGECKVEEWFEYNGDPYHFRVITTAYSTGDNIAEFNRLARYVKNTRSFLDSVSIHRIIYTRGNHSAKTAFQVVNSPPIHCRA